MSSIERKLVIDLLNVEEGKKRKGHVAKGNFITVAVGEEGHVNSAHPWGTLGDQDGLYRLL